MHEGKVYDDLPNSSNNHTHTSKSPMQRNRNKTSMSDIAASLRNSQNMKRSVLMKSTKQESPTPTRRGVMSEQSQWEMMVKTGQTEIRNDSAFDGQDRENNYGEDSLSPICHHDTNTHAIH